MVLFEQEWEKEAIERIQKFARIAEAMGFDIAVGFSGGKDSLVIYDLCKRSGIKFIAFFSHSFESSATLKFIRDNYPDVIWRREVKDGWFANIWKNHNSILPTTEIAYCCEDYKHNPKTTYPCTIVGVRKAESNKRAGRRVFETKNKTIEKKNRALFREYFSENCTGSGAPSILQLKPIVDWSDEEVWGYIKRYNLKINPEYKEHQRIGCVLCPKANLLENGKTLMKYPKMIDCIIAVREKRGEIDWKIHSEKLDLTNDKVQYVCRWLNHSFRPFSKRQMAMFKRIKETYDAFKHNTL